MTTCFERGAKCELRAKEDLVHDPGISTWASGDSGTALSERRT